MSYNKTLYKIMETLLKIPGLQLKNQTRIANIRLATSFVILCLVAALSVVEVVLTYKTIETLGKAEIFPVYLKNAITVCYYVSTKTNWKKVAEDIEETFWDESLFTEALRAQQTATSMKVMKVLKTYLGIMGIASIFYFVKPAFFKQLPFLLYTFCDVTDIRCYSAVYLCEVFASTFNVCFVMGFDVLLIYQVMRVYLEFDAVKHRLKEIDFGKGEEVVVKEINELVEHHGVILGVTSGMREIWSVYLLMLYWMSTISICLGFFLMTIKGIPPSFDDFSKYSSFIFAFVTELMIYCAAGTILMEQSTSVSKVAFEVNWWVRTQPKIRRALTMMIQRANKPGILDVGGVTPMTLVMFPQILKTSFSFYTLMQNLGGEEEETVQNTEEEF